MKIQLRRSYMLLILILFFSWGSFAQSGSGLEFRNPVLESGTAGTDGAVYRFAGVTSGIDALVTINGRSDNLVNMLNIDMNSSGFDAAFQPQVGYNNGTAPGPADWWMEFDIEFVEPGTTTPTELLEFNVSGVDIDGNGQYINEYLSFYRMESYSFEASSGLTVSGITEVIDDSTHHIGRRFDGPTANFTNIDTGATVVMVSNRYVNTSHFVVRTGGRSSAVSGASDRMYSLYFRGFNYNAPHQITLAIKEKPARYSPVVTDKAVLNLYPNPTVSLLSITLNTKWMNKTIQLDVYSVSGRPLVSRRVVSADKVEALSVGHLPPGMYILKIKNGDFTEAKTFLKS